jgi:hypothetical protein
MIESFSDVIFNPQHLQYKKISKDEIKFDHFCSMINHFISSTYKEEEKERNNV